MITFSLAARKWNDDDLILDIEEVEEALHVQVKEMSSFDRYQTELNSGNLHWTPVHNEKFWRENIEKFEEDNYKLIKYVGCARFPFHAIELFSIVQLPFIF